MQRHLLILIGGHLATAPRVQKEAAAASRAGFRVSVRGMSWDSDLLDEDRQLAANCSAHFEPLVDLSSRSLGSILVRLELKLSRLLYRHFGLVTPLSFGPTARLMLREALHLRPDLVMVHSEAGLWSGKKLLEHGFRVGVDFEDWFSEDLTEAQRRERPIEAMRNLEHHLLNRSAPVFTTSEAMSVALSEFSGGIRRPTAIPNAFPVEKSHCSILRPTGSPLRFYWFSQTIGPERGLEELAEAVEGLPGNWEIHLRGNLRGYQDWFDETFLAVPRDRLFLHAPVSNADLSAESAEFDIGLALEKPISRSRDLTASNKIFEYLRSGLAVIASKTKGQLEVMERSPKAGWLVDLEDPDSLRDLLSRCLGDPSSVQRAREGALLAAEEIWNWDSYDEQIRNELSDALRT
ncbi:MAG: glycosyl transferase family 1 [Verrucomicrobiota bacterium]